MRTPIAEEVIDQDILVGQYLDLAEQYVELVETAFVEIALALLGIQPQIL